MQKAKVIFIRAYVVKSGGSVTLHVNEINRSKKLQLHYKYKYMEQV